MKTFSLGMRTVRREGDYCRSTLSRLVECWALSHPQVRGFHSVVGDGLPPNETAVRALEAALRDGPDWVLLLEDDLDFCNDFIGSVDRWLERWAEPEIHFYPLGCFDADGVAGARSRGAFDWNLSGYYGSQAVALRAHDAASFLDWFPDRPALPADPGWFYPRDRCLDLHLAAWHREIEPKQETVRTPAPSLVDHIGEISSIDHRNHGLTGRILAFGGREFSYG